MKLYNFGFNNKTIDFGKSENVLFVLATWAGLVYNRNINFKERKIC